MNNKKWIKRGRYLVGGGLLILTLIILFYTIEGYRGARLLAEKKSELAEKGEPLTMAEMIPHSIPDDQNLAMHPLFAGLDWEEGKLHDDPFGLPDTVGEVSCPQQEAYFDFAAWRPYVLARYDNDKSLVGMNDSELILHMLNDMPLDELHTAVHQRPLTRWPIRYDLLFAASIPHIHVLRRAAKMLQLRAMALESMGRNDEALEDLIVALKLAKAAGKGGFLIGALVENSMASGTLNHIERMLNSGKWEDVQVTKIQQELETLEPLKSYRNAWRWERAVFMGAIVELTRDDLVMLQSVGDGNFVNILSIRPFYHLYPEGWKNADAAFYIKMTQEYVIDAIHIEKGWVDISQVEKGERELVQKIKTSRFKHLYSSLLLPVLTSSLKQTVHYEARRKMLLTAIMIEKFRKQNKRLPESLDEVFGDQRPVFTVDPATGRSLRYRKDSDEDYILYSLGLNMQDDGGNTGSPKGRYRDAPDWVLQMRRN